MTQSILVTGAAGFIGSHFVELVLQRSPTSKLVCVDNFNDYYSPSIKRANVQSFANHPRVQLLETSFCDSAAMQRVFAAHNVTHVVHLGAYAGVQASIARPLVYEESNVRGTLSLLEAARCHPVRRFVLVSSSTVYGDGAATPFQEDAPPGVPLSPYAASKQSAEAFGLMYFKLHAVPVVCIRPFSVYGPRVRPDLAMAVFANAILDDQPIPLNGDGSVKRDFTHVSDICDGLYEAMSANGVEGEAINLGHHEPVAIRKLIECLEESLGRKAKINYRPPVACDMPITLADLSKARRLLGYDPKVKFEAGVKAYAEWLQATRKLTRD